MKREVLVMLMAASTLGSGEVEAQRGRDRGDRNDRDGNRVERLEPVHAPGRVVARPVYRREPHRAGRAGVVYSTRRYRPGYRTQGAWIRIDWGTVVRYRPVRHRSGRAFLNHGDLRRLLGKPMLRDIRDAGHAAGLRGPLRGEWIPTWGGEMLLVVTMGGSDVAELVDYDRDGFMDEVFFLGPRGYRPMVYGR